MEDERAIGDLENYLVKLKYDIDDLRGFARDAGLDTTQIVFDGKSAKQVCGNVVKRAWRERKLHSLADAVLRDRGGDDPDRELLAIISRLPMTQTTPLPPPPPPYEGANTTPNVIVGPVPSTSVWHKNLLFAIVSRIILHYIKFTSKSTFIAIILLLAILLYTTFHFILLSTPLLATDLLAVLPARIIFIDGSVVILLALVCLMLLFLLLKKSGWPQWIQNRWKLPDQRWLLAINIGLLVIMVVNLLMSTSFQQKIQSTVESSANSPYMGLCDGRCNVDRARLDGAPKALAVDELNNQHRSAACAYLELAENEDQTDAEARIYYEDQCSGKNFTPLTCPCVNYVAAIALVQEKQGLDGTYSDPALYNNGVSRSILQAVYLQQETWNKAHKNGPAMYVFVANVGDVNDIQGAQQWQQSVAQQIISLQQTDKEHHIDGVVGLPQGMDAFISQLDNQAIPMVSLASLSSGNAAQYSYLLSVAPTTEIEASAAVHFLTKDIIKNKQKPLVNVIYYKPNVAYFNMATVLDNELQNDNVDVRSYPYDDLLQNTNNSIPGLAVSAATNSDAIVFIGPVNDLLTFMLDLRRRDQTTPVLSSNTTYQLVYNYQPADVTSAIQGLYFTAFAYHETQDYTDPLASTMVKEFKDAYGSKAIHVGNIYTYQLPTSDAIVAFDAMGIFIQIDHSSTQHTSDWQTQQELLARNLHTMVSGSITLNSVGNTPQTKTVLLLQIRSRGIYYIDKNP